MFKHNFTLTTLLNNFIIQIAFRSLSQEVGLFLIHRSQRESTITSQIVNCLPAQVIKSLIVTTVCTERVILKSTPPAHHFFIVVLTPGYLFLQPVLILRVAFLHHHHNHHQQNESSYVCLSICHLAMEW